MSAERRSARRLVMQRDCEVVMGDVATRAQLSDISAIGCAITSAERPNIGDDIVIRHGAIGDVRGKVVRHTEDGFGVQFSLNRETLVHVLRAVTLDLGG